MFTATATGLVVVELRFSETLNVLALGYWPPGPQLPLPLQLPAAALSCQVVAAGVPLEAAKMSVMGTAVAAAPA